MTDTDFVQWLNPLLSERKRLRALVRDLFRARVVLADVKAAQVAEARIYEFVIAPLAIEKSDRPYPHGLVDAVCELPDIFSSPRCVDSPERAFDYPLGGGIIITNPLLKDRLTNLCGSLDDVIARQQVAS